MSPRGAPPLAVALRSLVNPITRYWGAIDPPLRGHPMLVIRRQAFAQDGLQFFI
jgi:hypothetical protein